MLKKPVPLSTDQQLPDSATKQQFQAMAKQLVVHALEMEKFNQAHAESNQPRGIFYHQIMELLEKPLLELALSKHHYSRTKTAEFLGISRGSLRTRLHSYHIGRNMNPVEYGKQHSIEKKGE